MCLARVRGVPLAGEGVLGNGDPIPQFLEPVKNHIDASGHRLGWMSNHQKSILRHGSITRKQWFSLRFLCSKLFGIPLPHLS